MARQTTNYGFNISEGTDLVNPLTDIFPNFENIDTDLKGVSDRAVGTATELLTGTVHALVRSDSDRNVFTFTATSNFKAGETFTLDGVQVTALTSDGQTLSTGCYIIGSEVLVAVKGTLMTVYVNPSKALDSDKLDGHDSTYYATASDVSDLSGDVSALSSKVGVGTLTVGNDCVDGINTLNTHLTQSIDKITEEHNTAWSGVVTVNNETKLITFSVTILNCPNGSVLYINKDAAPSADTFFYSMMDGSNKVSLQFYTDGRVVVTQVNNNIPIVNTTISGMYISH